MCAIAAVAALAGACSKSATSQTAPSTSIDASTQTTAGSVTTSTALASNVVIVERGYTESGPGTKTFAIDLTASETAIVGGYMVDGVSNGVYKTVCGPGSFTSTVTDGFFVIVASDMAQAELDMRLALATDNGWARDHVTVC